MTLPFLARLCEIVVSISKRGRRDHRSAQSLVGLSSIGARGCRSSNSAKNTSKGLRNPSPNGSRERKMRKWPRSSLSRGTRQGSFSIVGPARRIRSSRWTRLAGRPAMSAIARRRIEARAHSDQSGFRTLHPQQISLFFRLSEGIPLPPLRTDFTKESSLS